MALISYRPELKFFLLSMRSSTFLSSKTISDEFSFLMSSDLTRFIVSLRFLNLDSKVISSKWASILIPMKSNRPTWAQIICGFSMEKVLLKSNEAMPSGETFIESLATTPHFLPNKATIRDIVPPSIERFSTHEQIRDQGVTARIRNRRNP